ncbi:hypothetical protein OROGR_015054 [Orobanche gracilis]
MAILRERRRACRVSTVTPSVIRNTDKRKLKGLYVEQSAESPLLLRASTHRGSYVFSHLGGDRSWHLGQSGPTHEMMESESVTRNSTYTTPKNHVSRKLDLDSGPIVVHKEARILALDRMMRAYIDRMDEVVLTGEPISDDPALYSVLGEFNGHSAMFSTLVLAELGGGFVRASSLSAVEAAKHLGEDNFISLLVAGSGPSLQEAADHAASCHPSISQVDCGCYYKLCEQLVEKVICYTLLVAGSGPSLQEAADHAASCHPSISQKVLVADTDNFAYPLAELWGKLVHVVQQKGCYSHIIAVSGSFGKNILPRAAALLDVFQSLMSLGSVGLIFLPIYAGNALSTVRYTGSDPYMLTIRSASFPSEPVSACSISNAASIEKVDLSTFNEDDAVGKSKYISLSSQGTEHPDLGNARIVVTGGRALRSAENFKLIAKLAEKLGAAGKKLDNLINAVGATRAAVDAGFVPNELQVGQTGKIVAPEIYMAFGVSGAIQHLAGMRDSKVIVAVNKDADAPIFQLLMVADYGIVGDLFKVIPEMLEKLPEKN